MLWDITKELLPALKEAMKDGLRAAARSRKKRRHLFVQKAIGLAQEHQDYVERHRFTLEELDRRLLITQVKDASRGELTLDLILRGEVPPSKEEPYKKRLAQQQRLGLPGLHDSKRRAKLEQILQDMCHDGDLTFWPPDRYSLRINK